MARSVAIRVSAGAAWAGAAALDTGATFTLTAFALP